MLKMRCNNIKPEYNSLLFKIKQTAGDRMIPRTSDGIYSRPIPEGYYMYRKSPKKINPVINFFKRMYETMKGIIEDTKPDEPKHFDIDSKDAMGSTIQI